MDDFPTKEEAQGIRKKGRRNPYARELGDPKYKQRIKGGKKGVRRRRQKDYEVGDDGYGYCDIEPGELSDPYGKWGD